MKLKGGVGMNEMNNWLSYIRNIVDGEFSENGTRENKEQDSEDKKHSYSEWV